ncbi:MAG: carbon storage regulator [Solirubrobacteraceae bacterium]
MWLVLTLKRDESIMIGDDIEVTVLYANVAHDRVKLGISAPPGLPISYEDGRTGVTPAHCPAVPVAVGGGLVSGGEKFLRRVVSTLRRAGITTVADWRAADEQDLLMIPNIGLESLARVSRALGANGEAPRADETLAELLGVGGAPGPQPLDAIVVRSHPSRRRMARGADPGDRGSPRSRRDVAGDRRSAIVIA